MKLVSSIAICEAAGILGSLFTESGASSWYAGIVKPSFNPPSWVFAPVWTALFVLMGIALFLVWKRGGEAPGAKKAILFFAVQLALNMLWSFLFFGLHSPLLAFIEIIVLWCAIIATIFAYVRVSRPAAYLLVPYLLWVTFAGYLNYTIWMLN